MMVVDVQRLQHESSHAGGLCARATGARTSYMYTDVASVLRLLAS